MKTTKRSKMLLSSIAMLLVALVALGSASFAWYFTQDTVTASGTSWSAKTADGLVIRHGESDTWKIAVTDLNTTTALAPATINYATDYSDVFGGTGLGTSRESGTLSGGLTGVDLPAATNTNFLIDAFDVASNSASGQLASFTVNGATNNATYLNLAIYVNNKLAAVMTSDGEAGAKVAGQAGGTSKSEITAVTSGDDLVALTKLANGTVIGKFTAAPKSSGGTSIKLIGFADGFNTKCTSALANSTAVPVDFSFSTTTGTANLGV